MVRSSSPDCQCHHFYFQDQLLPKICDALVCERLQNDAVVDDVDRSFVKVYDRRGTVIVVFVVLVVVVFLLPPPIV